MAWKLRFLSIFLHLNLVFSTSGSATNLSCDAPNESAGKNEVTETLDRTVFSIESDADTTVLFTFASCNDDFNTSATMGHLARMTAENNSVKKGSNTGCCKVCKRSQPCGDACIPWHKTCRKGIGCACHG